MPPAAHVFDKKTSLSIRPTENCCNKKGVSQLNYTYICTRVFFRSKIILLFSSLSTRRTTYSPIKLARKVGVCVLLLGIIIIKVLCVLHSLRGPTPVVVVLFFLVFFSSVLFLHFALFCAFYVYIRRRREDRFQSKIRHLARSQSHN